MLLEERINKLRGKIIEYASLAETMLEKSIAGLLNKDKLLLDGVIFDLENKANEMEIELDEECIALIVQFQPKARDLRIIMMILKMNNDIERMADHAVNIAQAAKFLIERPQVKPLIDIPRLMDEVRAMLKKSIDSFIKEDAFLAKSVCQKDDIVDGLREQIVRELITYMSSDPTTIERAIRLIAIANNLERIADLSTNICEDVIFMVQGKIIKHHKDEP
jgi:phosphate transport system protein